MTLSTPFSTLSSLRRRFRLSRPMLCLGALTLLAILWRLYLLSQHWPIPNSDEATMGLMSLHIAYRGEHPLVYYGQDYMGTIQAYLGALLMRISGNSFLALRLGILLIYVAFMLSFYWLVRFLYTPIFALFILLLLSLGWDHVIEALMIAIGGYPEVTLFCTLLFLLVYHLTITASTTTQRQSLRRLLAYLAVGTLAGLALWSSQIVLPAILAISFLLLFFCRREVFTLALPVLSLGLVLGLLPLIVYNLTAPPGHNALGALIGNVFPATHLHLPFVQKLENALLVTLPLSTGFPTLWGGTPFCSITETAIQPHTALNAVFPDTPANGWICVATRGSWSLVLISLWVVAMIHTLRRLHRVEGCTVTLRDQRMRVQVWMHLSLLVCGALWFILYSISTTAGSAPQSSTRYLIGLIFVAPCVFWPLWLGAERNLRRGSKKHSQAIRALGVGYLILLACLPAICLQNAGEFLVETSQAREVLHTRLDLIQHLEQLNATRIYSDYWTCGVLIFQSNERVICSSLDQHLQPGFDRYLPYRTSVHQAPHPAYVFARGFLTTKTWQKKRMELGLHYQTLNVDGYMICFYRQT